METLEKHKLKRVPVPPAEGQRWFAVEEAAWYLKRSIESLYKKVQRRQIPFNREPGSRTLTFDRLALDKHLERYSVRAIDRRYNPVLKKNGLVEAEHLNR